MYEPLSKCNLSEGVNSDPSELWRRDVFSGCEEHCVTAGRKTLLMQHEYRIRCNITAYTVNVSSDVPMLTWPRFLNTESYKVRTKLVHI